MRVLLSRTDLLGDAIVTSAFIETLKKTIPNLILDVLCHEHNLPAFRYHPLVNDIYVLDHQQGTKKAASNYHEIVTKINSKCSYDLILQLNGCIRTYKYISKISSRQIIARRLITKSVSSRLWIARKKLSGKFMFFNENLKQHEVIRLHQFLDFILAHLGINALYSIPEYAKFYPEPDFSKPDFIPRSIIINASGKKDAARYINDSLLYSLLSFFQQENLSNLAVIVLPEDHQRVISILIDLSLDKIVQIICIPDLYQLAKVISRYEVFISADGGLVHIAAGLGVRCVSIFNNYTESLIWYPWTTKQKTLSSERSNIYDVSYKEVLAATRI